jgi:hypothetical protein
MRSISRPLGLGLVALIGIAILAALAACTYPNPEMVDQHEIARRTTDYLSDLAKGQEEDAYSLLDPDTRSHCEESRFASQIELVYSGHEAIETADPSVKVEDIEIDGKAATATVVFNNASADDALGYHYVKQGAHWYVSPPNLRC